MVNDIYHIISNRIVGHYDFKSAKTNTDKSDHFLIVFALKTNKEPKNQRQI